MTIWLSGLETRAVYATCSINDLLSGVADHETSLALIDTKANVHLICYGNYLTVR